MNHVCKKCGIEKELNKNNFLLNFNKKYNRFYFEKTCKKCRYLNNSQNRKRRYAIDPIFREKVKARSEEIRRRHLIAKDESWLKRLESLRLSKQKNKEKNREKNKTRDRERHKKRWSNITYKINKIISNKINQTIKDKNKKNVFDLLGYTQADFMKHIEKLFEEGMSWDNYGEWHIDHIKPICSFNLQSFNDGDFKKCWSLHNLRPLWKKDNLKKSAEDKLLKFVKA